MQAVELNVPAEILQRIDALAAKVGATAGHLWPALVRYEYADSCATLCACATVCLLAVIAASVIVRYALKNDNEDILAMTLLPLVVFATACLIGTSQIASIVSPEAAALRSLLGE